MAVFYVSLGLQVANLDFSCQIYNDWFCIYIGEHYAEFSIDAGLITGFNPRDKVTWEFRIILSLMKIIASDAEFHL